MVFPQKNARHLGKKTQLVRRFRRKLRVVSEENNTGEREKEKKKGKEEKGIGKETRKIITYKTAWKVEKCEKD